MKNFTYSVFILFLVLTNLSGFGQILVKTDFSAGLPVGWTNTNIQGTQLWTFQSAPSLSSTSGGQYAVFDDASLGGVVHPNEAALITPTLDCTGRTNMIVSFYHFWDDVENTHAYVEVSNDNGTTWTQVYNDGTGVKGSLGSPEFQRIDISTLAAGFSQVKVRFRYTDGNVSGKVWYLDDVTIYSDPDVGITDLVAPIYANCGAKTYTANENVIVKVFNFSAENITSTPVTCEVTVGGVTQIFTGTTGAIPANSSIDFNIGTLDMTVEDVYHFNIFTTLGTDTYIANNSFQTGRKPITTIYPYSEDFNTSKSGWINSAAASTRQFLWGAMPNLGGDDGEGNSWYFHLSSINETDKPYVESPIFDFTYLTNPKLSIDIKSSVDGSGGAQIQYSINGGAWTVLGSSNDPGWYTGNAWTMDNCWTNTNLSPLNTWTTMKYNCCILSGQSCVQFRIYSFAYQTDAARSSFAFDNFKISESQKDDIKVVMFEKPSAGGCSDFTATEPVKIKVYNNTCKPITNIPITVELSGPNTQTITDHITGTLNRFSNLSYTLSGTLNMSNPGDYTLVAYIDDQNATGTNLDFYRDTVLSNNTVTDYRYSRISTYPYIADFNSGNMGWSTGEEGTDRFFTRGTVTFLSGSQGQGDSWYLDFSSTDNNTSKAWVESPPFDLTGLTNPILYVDMKYSFNGSAGASVEFSTDGGTTWSTLGTKNDPFWHNGDAWTMDNCVTTSSSNNWTTKQHSLCNFKTESCIKFRIRAFSHYTDEARRSFAFDNFRIQDNVLDVAVTNIIQPDASLVGCLYDANQKVTVKVYNWNCSDYTNVPLKCDVTGVVSAHLTGTLFNAVNNDYSTFLFPGSFDMTAVGTYNFRTYSDDASDDFRKNDTTKLTITTTVPKIVTFPYSEDFNSGQGGWINSDAISTRQMLFGPMPDLGGADGEGDSWFFSSTSGNSTDKSYVESPVFDFTYLTKPTLYFDVKYSFDGASGAQIQYSLDGGTSWNLLGLVGEPDWYTGNAWTMDNCWTNNSASPVSTWTTMKHNLCYLSGEPCVIFRIYSFAYYNDAPRRSFAFDNFRISNNQKDDLELQLFELPGSGDCAGFSNNETVRIRIFNNTCKPITNIPVTCELSGAASQTINGIIPGQVQRFSSYTYTFGSTFDMSTAGNYQLKAYINNENLLGTGLDYYRDTVEINNTIIEDRYGIINTFPYLADFNNSTQGWTTGKDAADRYMVHGPIPFLNGPEGEVDSWYLDILAGNTTNRAWVVSPKFNLSGLTNPILYMDVKYSLDGASGGQVQYSTNSGGTWQDLGNSSPPDWYNGNSWTMDNCFMGNNTNPTNKWTTKQYRLCEIGASTCVIFRVNAFAYYTDEAKSSFAFDNFRLQDNTIDVKVTQITEPDANVAGCLYENNQHVTVKVYNWNCSSVTNVPVQCDVSGISPATLNGTVPAIPAHDFATYQIPSTFDMTPVGVYNFTSYTNQTGDNLVDNDTTKLSITVTVPKISTFPYLADFNGSTNSWIASSTTSNRQMVHGVMPDLGGEDGAGDSWYLYTPSDNTTERAYVRSPVFNFAGKSNLFILMDIKYSFYAAGAQIEYSTNGGANWTIIGDIGEPTWYDDNVWTMDKCWTNNSANPQNIWRTVIHNICNLDNNSCVIFRVASFAYYFDAPRSSFAFDNFRVVENYQDVTAYQFLNHNSANDKCIYPATQNIQVRYYNIGCNDVTSVPVKCEVSGAMSQTYTSSVDIPAKSFVDYTFTPTFSYDNNGIYNIKATIDLPGDNEESNDTLNIITNILYHNKITTFPYLEDFNSGFGDWTPSANFFGREMRAGILPYLNGSETNAGTCYFFITNTDNTTDKTWVESPVFDITGLINPILSMEIKWALHGSAGAQVEYSTDGGVNYQPLGNIGDPTWHTGDAWTLNNCWTNNSGNPQNTWKLVQHDLCGLVGATCLRFRIKAFSYYTDEIRSSFAFDNFTITDSPVDAQAVFVSGCYGSEYSIDLQVKNNTYFCAGAMPAITSLDISYSINGGSTITQNIATNISPGATDVVTINNITIPDISSSLKVWIKNPNGLTDEIQLNDTVDANISAWPACNDHCSNAVRIISKITQASQTNNATPDIAEDPAFSCNNNGQDGLPGTPDDIEITKENTVWYWFSTDCDGGDVDVKFTNIRGAGCSNGIQVSIDRLDAEPVCDPTNYTNVFCTFPDNKADIVWNGISLGIDEKYYITVDGVASGQCDFDIEVSGSVSFDPDKALAGSYTIDPDNPNYPNFQSALDSLKMYGVQAPVTFLVRDTIYNEQLVVKGICGVNADTTITFTSICDDCSKPKVVFNASESLIACGSGFSKSLAFDGANDYVVVNLDEPETEITHEFWFRTSNASTGLFGVGSGSLGSSGCDRHLYLSGGNIFARVWSNQIISSTGKNYADGKWHHIAHVIGASVGGQQIYVDGVMVASGNKTASDFTTQTQVYFGYSNDMGYFRGEMDEVRIWNVARTEAQINADMCTPLTGTETGLIAYYNMEDGSGNSTLADISGNGRTGTLTNMDNANAWFNSDFASEHDFGTSIILPEADDRVIMPITWTPSEFTIEWWMYPTSHTNYNQSIGSGWDKWNFHTDSNGSIYCGTNVATRFSPTEIPSETIALNEWQHFAFTYVSGVGKLYKNGNLLASKAMPASLAWTDLTIWSVNQIDELRLWSKARTTDEIRNNMYESLTGTEPDLYAYYNMEDGTGSSVLTDVSVNSYDGTLTNMNPATDWVTSGVQPKCSVAPVSASFDNYTMKLSQKAKFFNFNRIDFSALDPAKSRVVQINEASNITFTDCVFNGDLTLTDDLSDRTLVYSSGNLTVDSLYFTNCGFVGGSNAFFLESTGTGYIDDVQILNSTFSNQSKSFVELVKNRNPKISFNDFSSDSQRDDFKGISLNNITGAYRIQNNSILANSADGNGIYLNGVTSTAGSQGLISNNMLAIGNNVASYGLNIENASSYQNIYFNTFNMNSTLGSALKIDGLDNADLKNNIFVSGSGTSADIINLTNSTENYNAFNPLFAGKGANSINQNPGFISSTDLHTEEIALKVGTPIATFTNDIDGETRNLTTPYIGADEFLGLVSWTGAVNTDWNNTGNWDSGHIPTKGTTVLIPNVANKPLINSAASKHAQVRNITINSSSKLEIEPLKYLTVYKTFTNNGEIRIKSNSTGTGSFIPKQNPGTILGTGNSIMELYLSANKWHYLSSPIVSSPALSNSNFYYWDETKQDRWLNNDFVDWTDGTTVVSIMGWTKASGAMTVGKGYAHYLFDLPKTYTFNGTFNSGDYTVNLDFTDHGGNAVQDMYDGWNLLANPYPSTINWNSDGIELTNVDNAVYVYNDAGDAMYNNYEYYMKSSSGSPYPLIALNSNQDSCHISPGQSVMVRANASGAKVKITNQARQHYESTFYKSGEKHPNLLKLAAEHSGNTDELAIRFIPEASSGFDGEFDAIKRFSGSAKVPQISTQINAGDLAINTLSEISDGLTIPLSFYAGEQGKYSIKEVELNFDANVDIYLIDRYLSKRIKLNDTPEYSFKTEAGDVKDRFYIVFKLEKSLTEENPEESVGFDELIAENVQIYSVKKSVNIKFENVKGSDNQVIVQDVLGKKVIHQKLVSDNTILPMDNFAAGNYIVKVITRNKVYEQKVFIK